ncbi:hypothetical protein TWF694_001236 [Orbilia ellipsospora]|uniref:Uncharacterized protein n=1 Tax=Orbilia ellipsospora TaxID=2528407 RepID=A0AAV9XRG9_9PEZI
MDTIKKAANDAAWMNIPPRELHISGVLDEEAPSSLDLIAREIIECQQAADGTLESSRKFLSKLYAYNFIWSLQSAAESSGSIIDVPSEDLLLSLCEALRPTEAIVEEIDLEKDPFKGLPPLPHLAVFKATAGISLSIICDILTLNLLDSKPQIKHDVALAVATHSDRSVDWYTDENGKICESILDAYASTLAAESILVGYVLKMIIKPLFGKVPGSITETGRKAIRKPQTKPEVFTFADEKPWIKERPEALSLLMFTVNHLQDEGVEQNWHLIVPPILTTLDEGDIVSKSHACEILNHVIRSVSPQFLSRTGLGSVFEEAISPCLHYVPPLTPINHASRSFKAAVGALVGLSTRRYADKEDKAMRYQALDKILREGVFHGMTYAGENVKMVEVFLEETSVLVGLMGVRCVRHLSKLVSFCTAPMTSPFVMTYPEVAYRAASTLIEIIRNCWARVSEYNAEILKAVVFCWMHVKDEEPDWIVELLREELKVVMVVLEHANRGTGWFEKARTALVGKEKGFEALFELIGSKGLATGQ